MQPMAGYTIEAVLSMVSNTYIKAKYGRLLQKPSEWNAPFFMGCSGQLSGQRQLQERHWNRPCGEKVNTFDLRSKHWGFESLQGHQHLGVWL